MRVRYKGSGEVVECERFVDEELARIEVTDGHEVDVDDPHLYDVWLAPEARWVDLEAAISDGRVLVRSLQLVPRA